jgi:periplasmic divalent cation tolerance protein
VSDFVLVSTTTDKREEADKIAHLLVERGLAACVQTVGPISSTYRWKDEVERAEEWLLLIKTRGALFERVEKLIKENHAYEVPEIVLVPIRGGSEEYLRWLDENLTD